MSTPKGAVSPGRLSIRRSGTDVDASEAMGWVFCSSRWGRACALPQRRNRSLPYGLLREVHRRREQLDELLVRFVVRDLPERDDPQRRVTVGVDLEAAEDA